MNIRLASDSVRVRVTLEEAKVLQREGKIQQSLALGSGLITLEVITVKQQETPITFSFIDQTARTKLLSVELAAIIEGSGSRGDGIYTEIESTSGQRVEIAFEVDLFSRKKQTTTEGGSK